MNLETVTQQNLTERLQNNPYPGRGIVIGRNEQEQWIQVYWIMGRSSNSRNRIFVYQDNQLQTQAADPSKVEDPSLIIYNAMLETSHHFVVTNGSQTDVIRDHLEAGKPFESALLTQYHEPDDPNYTPRISGCLDLSEAGPQAMLSIIKRSPFDTNQSEYHVFRYPTVASGFGYCITTYQGDGNPIPSFVGTPYLLALHGDAATIAETFWNALNEANKISLVVKAIDSQAKQSQVVLKNKYTPVPA